MEMESGKLFIGGISWDTSEERLREYFQTFGEIVEAVIMRDTTGRARGFGFIVFANASDAERVVREKHVIDGRTVEAKKAVPRDDHQNFNRGSARTKKIFVGGLASTVTETDFKRHFDQFGAITDVVVMYDHNTQRSRGFGFITYDSEEAVDKVLLKNFHELNGKLVEVKPAVPKELSNGPTRSLSSGGGFNGYGGPLNRVSSFNGYGSNSPMRMEGRFSPVTVDRRGYPSYSPCIGLNLDLGFGLNYGPDQDSALGYGRSVNSSYYSGNTNRFGSGPIGHDVAGVTRNGPFVNNTNRSLWSSDGGLNYGSNNVNSNAGLFGSFRNIRKIDSFGGRANELGGKNGGTKSSYAVGKNIHSDGFGSLYGSKSFYTDHCWDSSPHELEGCFGDGRGANGDMTPNNSVGFAGGYNVNARPNGGIAA
ncbi:RNA-binding (RRM/RBD/RNP motifs) family protein [Striga asiatica]|uniref:RNA-binding (RRM/RBD/RNP motifs) family protein n=1 Tax=Striga asiatica TaxID=4170 RepID=A0A5A7R622_STRAF|nr:RNA-binding (RRM/RBD/RNP motifs) family protein [Striga asiatica]